MFIKVGKVNLDQLHGFLHLRNFVGHFQLQKTLHNVIIKKMFKAGFGSSLRKTAMGEMLLGITYSLFLRSNTKMLCKMLWGIFLRGTV